MKVKKIFFVLLSIVVILSIFAFNIFAYPYNDSASLGDYLVPDVITIQSYDDISFGYSPFIEPTTSAVVSGSQNEYQAFFLNDDSRTSFSLLFDSASESYYAIHLSYFNLSPVYYDGPFSENSIVYNFESGAGQDEVDISIEIDYLYYDIDGNLVNDSAVYSYMSILAPRSFGLTLRSYLADIYDVIPDGSSLFSFNLYVSFETTEYFSAFSFPELLSSEYGLTHFNTPPTNVVEIVNPNVLEWLVISFNSFMTAPIFGDITVGGIIALALAVPMVIWFMKLVAGG